MYHPLIIRAFLVTLKKFSLKLWSGCSLFYTCRNIIVGLISLVRPDLWTRYRMEWAEFLQGMSGDPQMLSAEYLDLIRLTKPKDEELTTMIIDHEFTTEDSGNTWKIVLISSLFFHYSGIGVSLLVSYVFSPFVFIMNAMDKWMEQRVKKILEKTSHLRRRYR